MLLHDLLQSLDLSTDFDGLPNAPVFGVKEDSRHIAPGDLFIARPGTRTDGRKFLAEARQRGALAAVVAAVQPEIDLPQVVIPDPAAAASLLAHALAGHPSRAVKVIGVTGTNGKTTSVYLLRHILRSAGHPCGMIGTVEIDNGKITSPASMTTPAAADIAQLLADMRDNRCDACAMEVSSHALDQRRAAGVQFAAAAFTNLTGDHLDYHGSMENYAAAKARLFDALPAEAVAVVNARDPWADRIVRRCPARIVRFGFESRGDYQARQVSVTSQGSCFELRAPGGCAPVRMSLIGRHNIENALAAAALAAEVFNLTPVEIAAALAGASGAPGRLQAVRAGQGFAVLVDYAHTDDALTNVLSALRPLARGRLCVLFGCGGDRDRTKRPRMAAVAEKLADVVYVTSDNPRTEMPLAILADIMSGFSDGYRGSVVVEADRRCAIERILADAGDGDIVLLAGKGHENYQIVGAVKHHFDDVEEAARVLARRKTAA